MLSLCQLVEPVYEKQQNAFLEWGTSYMLMSNGYFGIPIIEMCLPHVDVLFLVIPISVVVDNFSCPCALCELNLVLSCSLQFYPFGFRSQALHFP